MTAGSPVGRTVLAWDRTALALLGNGVLVLVRDLRGAGAVALVPAACALAAAVTVAALGRRRARRLRAAEAGDLAPLVVGGLVVAVGVAVLAVLLVGAP